VLELIFFEEDSDIKSS